MNIKYSVTKTAAIVRFGNELRIDRRHPHAQELAEIALEMKLHVKLLDADGEKGFKLLDRVQALAGKDAANALLFAWHDYLREKQIAAAEREARAWVSVWASMNPEDGPDMNTDLLRALYNAGRDAFPHAPWGGLMAVYAYAYQRGGMDTSPVTSFDVLMKGVASV